MVAGAAPVAAGRPRSASGVGNWARGLMQRTSVQRNSVTKMPPRSPTPGQRPVRKPMTAAERASALQKSLQPGENGRRGGRASIVALSETTQRAAGQIQRAFRARRKTLGMDETGHMMGAATAIQAKVRQKIGNRNAMRGILMQPKQRNKFENKLANSPSPHIFNRLASMLCMLAPLHASLPIRPPARVLTRLPSLSRRPPLARRDWQAGHPHNAQVQKDGS